MSETDVILSIRDLSKTFHIRKDGETHALHAVNAVSLSVRRGETLGIVGESGCGKSTLARVLLGLVPADGGSVTLNGEDLLSRGRRAMATTRLKLRMVFQDPYASLNPRRSVGDSVAEAGDIHRIFASKADRKARVAEALERVGLGAGSPAAIRTNCRAVSVSAWALPARSFPNPIWSSRTSRSRPSTCRSRRRF